ncbi:hypothetical protein RBEAN4_0121 [Rickettsia bellii str. RML An4]|uniref:Uncharacterized protein n=1 Tax=Rickettsia bellii str. RML An4 TaxID=1359193 RepID=A0A0F3Q9E0_RICBE|nr:hypothetical protein RBEAN4_0121 [Rickettsia bellii str. RML An4]
MSSRGLSTGSSIKRDKIELLALKTCRIYGYFTGSRGQATG